jgi:hypothetical protein
MFYRHARKGANKTKELEHSVMIYQQDIIITDMYVPNYPTLEHLNILRQILRDLKGAID